MKANETTLDGGTVLIDRPVITVIDCEVQHPTSQGEFTNIDGLIGVAVLIQPTGQPKLMLHIEHSDGTKLSTFLHPSYSVELIEMLIDAHHRCSRISMSAQQETRQ